MGKAILFSAPSGCGKTTIINELMKYFDCFDFSISATSRAPRGTEQDGKDYYRCVKAGPEAPDGMDSEQQKSMNKAAATVEQVLAGRVSTLDATMTDSKLKPTKWTDMTVMDLYKR